MAHARLAALEARDVKRADRSNARARKRPRGKAAAARLAQLWAPRASRLVLRGIRSQTPDGIGEIATSAADVHSKVAAHWAPVFCAPDVM